jgi:hypothetical protein
LQNPYNLQRNLAFKKPRKKKTTVEAFLGEENILGSFEVVLKEIDVCT